MEVGDVEAHEQNNEQSGDDVTIFIKEKLQKMSPTVVKCCIFRVPKRLFNMNPKAYVPQVISIGPFHHQKDGFKATEELKLRFLNSYLCRIGMSIQGIVEKARSWNEQARQCYSESIEMDDDEFVKMMLLDGCFLVELIVNFFDSFPQTEKMVDPSFYESIKSDIISDLTMLENQLPFFVLQALYDLLALAFSNFNLPCFEEVVHAFITTLVLPTQYKLPYDILITEQKPRHLLELLSYYFVPPESDSSCPRIIYLPPTATDLHEAGIILQKAQENEVKSMLDISFNDGVLKIPPFESDYNFETFVRNLVAFEQFSVRNNKYVHYIVFLDSLIRSEKDVSLLMKEEILSKGIGSGHTEIFKLFNDICKNVNLDDYNHFSSISEDLKRHCEARSNRWMASLKRNYFNSPWTLISLLAATFLIILTLLQTIFSAISVFPSN